MAYYQNIRCRKRYNNSNNNGKIISLQEAISSNKWFQNGPVENIITYEVVCNLTKLLLVYRLQCTSEWLEQWSVEEYYNSKNWRSSLEIKKTFQTQFRRFTLTLVSRSFFTIFLIQLEKKEREVWEKRRIKCNLYNSLGLKFNKKKKQT